MLKRLRSALRHRLYSVVDDATYQRQQDLLHRLDTVARELHQHIDDASARERDRVLTAIADKEHRDRRDLDSAGERDAVASSGRFTTSYLTGARKCTSPHDTLRYALSQVDGDGMAMEFGVYSGTTLRRIVEALPGRRISGFDSFEGLPEAWRPGFDSGAFAVADSAQIPDVPGAELVVGWFADVLPGYLADNDGPVAFLHLDADLYVSTRTVLDHVGPRLRVGSIVAFDEFFNYPSWDQHEYLAWTEFVAERDVRFSYLAYTVDHEQVVVRIDAIGPA